MTGRALVFSDPDVIRAATNDYIPVAADDWYQRRRDDEEGRFFRAVADQGPRKGEGGTTRQGVYLFTADGRLLGWKNSLDPAVMRAFFAGGLAAWRELPEARRRPGAVTVGDEGRVDPDYARTPPEGGLVVDVFTRTLERDTTGAYRKRAAARRGHDRAARDHLWITADECRALVPARPRVGQRSPLPPAVAGRIARFHLVDNTRGEAPPWKADEVRSQSLWLTVEQVSEASVGLRLDGSVVLATHRDPARAERGYEARVAGAIRHDRAKGRIDRFDVIAVGEHWGESRYTRGARPGRAPLGLAMSLAAGTSGADRVPPQGAREGAAYFGR